MTDDGAGRTPQIAIFDVDHTITGRSTGRRLVQYGRAAGLFGALDLARLPVLYLKYRAGTIELGDAIGIVDRLAGRTNDELTELAEECYRKHILADVMADARATIEAHQAAGDMVVLATSSIDIAVRPLAENLGIGHVLATSLAFAGGVATGHLDGLPCFGPEKLRRTSDLVSRIGGRIENSAFYSDSHLDLPLLEAVGTPVAVNPDSRLRRIARERGWRIVRFR